MQSNEKIKILVVDDSNIILYSLKNFFEEYNLEVITCLDGLEGIQKAIEHKPKLIFLDLMMPNFDGVKMLQVIKLLDDLKNIPVIVISAKTDKRNVLAALEAGADKVISKPLQKDVILKHLGEIVGTDFLKNAKMGKKLSDNDRIEIRSQLLKFFLQSFVLKKQAIIDAFEKRNVNLLKTIFHELKGTGGTIGYQELTKLSTDVEDGLNYYDINWKNIKTTCDTIFNLVEEIKNENKNLVNEC